MTPVELGLGEQFRKFILYIACGTKKRFVAAEELLLRLITKCNRRTVIGSICKRVLSVC